MPRRARVTRPAAATALHPARSTHAPHATHAVAAHAVGATGAAGAGAVRAIEAGAAGGAGGAGKGGDAVTGAIDGVAGAAMKALDARLVAQSAPSTAVTQTLAAASKPIHASAKGRAGGTGLTSVAWGRGGRGISDSCIGLA